VQIYYDYYKAIKISNKTNLPKDVEFYLYQILINPKIMSEPLAILASKAIEANLKEKISIYKQIADHSISIVSLFPQSVKVSEDYYVNMGRFGYSQLSGLQKKSTYQILSEKIEDCILTLKMSFKALKAR
jgi:hypothetical protein